MPSPIIAYLSHPYHGPGLRGRWTSPDENTDRVRRIAEGVRAALPYVTPRYPHGTGERDRENAGGWARRCRRLVVGDEPVNLGPHAIGAPPGYVAPADIVWVIGPTNDEVRADVATAERAGIPVERLSGDDQSVFLEAEANVRARREREITVRVAARVANGIGGPDFGGPKAVLFALDAIDHGSMTVSGIDYERMADRSGSSGAGGALAFRGAVDHESLRVVRALHVVRAAKVTPEELNAAVLREVYGLSWMQVADVLWDEDTDAAEKRAQRRAGTARRKIGETLRAEEAREVTR